MLIFFISIRRTAQQKTFVDVAVVFRPDVYQQGEQQGLEQYQQVENVDLEPIEGDEVEHDQQEFVQDNVQVGRRETIVQNGQRVELGERGQTVQTADRSGRRRIVQRDIVLGVLHYSVTLGTATRLRETAADTAGAGNIRDSGTTNGWRGQFDAASRVISRTDTTLITETKYFRLITKRRPTNNNYNVGRDVFTESLR